MEMSKRNGVPMDEKGLSGNDKIRTSKNGPRLTRLVLLCEQMIVHRMDQWEKMTGSGSQLGSAIRCQIF